MGRKKKPPAIKQIEVLSARVNIELYQRIGKLAKSSDLSVTQVMRAALREYLDNHPPKPGTEREAA